MPPTFQLAHSRGVGEWVVCLPSHMSSDYATKQEPSALPRGLVSQWYMRRRLNRCPDVLGQPPVSSQFGVNGSLNDELRPYWICRSIVEGESHSETERGGILNCEVRICPNKTQLSSSEKDSKVDVQMISFHSKTKYLSDKV